LGPDRYICPGTSTILDAGGGFTTYLWSTGETTRTITVSTVGTYSVTITKTGCTATDTLIISQLPAVSSSLDTTICYGAGYFAGGAMQSTSGIYIDTLKTSAGCDSVKTTNLTVKQRIPIDLGGIRSICPGETITLDATLAGATYTWQDSSTDSILVVNKPGIYWVQVTYNKCTAADTVWITECSAELWFPSAFTPNGDGVNDFFRPKGINIAKFHLTVYSRWGQMLFETGDMERGWDGSVKGILCPADTYTFMATYEGTEEPGKTKKVQGSFILMR
jgi:gliding motility-associated-like protein